MEQPGVERIFGRSIMKNKLRYTEYSGDVDTKGLSVVKDAYEGVTVIKKNALIMCKKVLVKGCEN